MEGKLHDRSTGEAIADSTHSALFTLNTHARFSTAGCRGWVYEQVIFVEVLTFLVEAVLVMRREYII